MTKHMQKELSPPGGWLTSRDIRIHPVKRDKAGPISRLILATIEKHSDSDISNLWLLMVKNRRLMRGLVYYVSKLMPLGKLKRIDTELVILRVAWNCRSQYEWGQHVELGLQSGLTVSDIRRIGSTTYGEQWSKKQIAILKACDEFHRNRFVEDDTWQMLSSYYNEKLLLEILFLIGFYEGLAGVLNSAGLPLEKKMKNKLSILIFNQQSR